MTTRSNEGPASKIWRLTEPGEGAADDKVPEADDARAAADDGGVGVGAAPDEEAPRASAETEAGGARNAAR